MKGSLFLVVGIMAMSCQSREDLEEKKIPRVLIIGNSITYHPPDASIGWNANWGMAARRPDLDYVSVLTDLLRNKHPLVEVKRENVYPFERGYDDFSFSTYAYLRDFRPDFLIVRLGENVDEEKLGEDAFKKALQDFVMHLSEGRKVDIIVTTTFWQNAPVSQQLIAAGAESGWRIVHLSYLGQDDQYMAIGQFENDAASRHPNDLGMREIATLIWEALNHKIKEAAFSRFFIFYSFSYSQIRRISSPYHVEC